MSVPSQPTSMQTARDKIRELRALHEDGLLSLQEFDARKNAILDAEYAPPGSVSAAPVAREGTELGLMASQEIGPHTRRYRLERLIAQGGMGQVWQATDLATHAELGHSATVALKILPPQLTQSASHAKLLIEEATQARRLAHENIVRVYEWAQDPATSSYFIIMEYLDGEDLDHLLARQGRFTLDQVLELLAPLGHALHYAWQKHKLVHRDIKPANIMLTARGDVKLLDFGIAARSRSGASSVGLEAPANSGTAGYRAPEAGTNQGRPGQALDVYALAVMIYQMVEGSMPFDGVRSASHQPRAPDALTAPQWAVLQSGFAYQAEQRPASVNALLEALRRAVGPSPEQLAAEAAAARALEARRQQALALARKNEAEAANAARVLHERSRREHEARARAEAEASALARKEQLRAQLQQRRLADAEQLRLEREEQERKLLQAKAAAAYRAEQQRARAELAARSAAELEAQLPSPSSPTADPQGVLRDRFQDASGTAPELVLIPTGRFQMGAHEHERKKAMQAGSLQAWVDRETPPHWVGIEDSFALGRYPVTVAQWRQFALATGWQAHTDVNWEAPGFPQSEQHPVVGVSWDDVQRYLAWLSAQTGQRYRLPSEAEWEYACRAGSKTAFSFGDSIDPAQASYDASQSYNASALGQRRSGTSAVTSHPPNPWGLHDMHGNVWEWVQDVVHDDYQGAPLSAQAWEQGGDVSRRVLRGGSWRDSPRYLRSALRNGLAAGRCTDSVGFRVARSLV